MPRQVDHGLLGAEFDGEVHVILSELLIMESAFVLEQAIETDGSELLEIRIRRVHGAIREIVGLQCSGSSESGSIRRVIGVIPDLVLPPSGF